MRKKLSMLFTLVVVCMFSISGCSLTGGINSKTFNITVKDVEGNSSKHSVILEFSKTKEELKYFLYQDGEEVANGNVGTSGGSKEYILDSGTKSKFEYKIKVISGDDELIKETTYSIGSSKSENLDSKDSETEKDKTDETDKDTTDDNNNEENKTQDNNAKEDTSNTNQAGLSEWSGESKDYKSGDKVTQDGVTYECINDHTSQATWTPKDSGSLWKKVE